MKRIYISGPISDKPDLNRAAFSDAVHRLTVPGQTTFNPHDIAPPTSIDQLSKREIWQYYMRECVKVLPDCQHIYMLRGWENSDGARWEFNLAVMMGLTVSFEGSRQ